MSVHAQGATYLFAHPLILDQTVLLMPAVNLAMLDTSSLDGGTFGYVIESNAATIIAHVADYIGARIAQGLPCILEVFQSLVQTLTLDAITTYNFPTAPTPTDLLNGAKAGIFAHTQEQARLDLILPGIIARLDSHWNGARPTYIFHDIEYDPTSGLCFNTPGAPGIILQALYASMLADPTLAAAIAALRLQGITTDNLALDLIIRRATRATIEQAWSAFGSVPHVIFSTGAMPTFPYLMRFNGQPNAIAVDTSPVGSWIYTNDGPQDTEDMILDLSLAGSTPQVPNLTVAMTQIDTANRMYAARDAGVNDLMLFCEQGAGQAGAELTALQTILDMAQQDRITPPTPPPRPRRNLANIGGMPSPTDFYSRLWQGMT